MKNSFLIILAVLAILTASCSKGAKTTQQTTINDSQILVFPSGIGYDKQNNRVRTKRVNSIFSSIPLLTKDLDKIKSGEPVDFNQFSARVTSTGDSSNFLEDLKTLQ